MVLNTVCCMFAEYCERPFEVEPVEVVDALGRATVYPDLAPHSMEVDVAYVNKLLGLSLDAQACATLLQRMQLAASVSGGGSTLSLQVPPTRSDILHACDVMEDVAIAYGFNNIPRHVPTTSTQGRELPLNQLSELLRQECAMAGYTEILTWALLSKAENFTHLRKQDDGATAVEIGNPATAEFEVCRTSLLPSALKTLGANKDTPLPIKLFEVSDVVMLSPEKDVGAKNERRLCVVHCGRESGFELVQGVLNRVMEVLGVPLRGAGDAALEAKFGGSYHWAPCDEPTFFPGRQAAVYARGVRIGTFGIVHPEVLEKFDISSPVSALEINLEPFCFDQFYKPFPDHQWQ